MKTKRPDLKVGDVVRLSHRGEKLNSNSCFNSAMTVVAVPKAIQDGRDRIRVAYNVNNRVAKISFMRKDLWFTGHNIYAEGKQFSVTKQKPVSPQNAVPNWFTFHVPQQGMVMKPVGPYSMGCSVVKHKVPDPCKQDEVKCSCGRMADRGHACWWCGKRN
jgi:hypothetical protein